jgi:hypothetical protein
MNLAKKAVGIGLAALAVAMGSVGLSITARSTAQAAAMAPAAMSPAKADDFMLADQNYLAHQLHRMSDAKAVVLITYANDPAVRRDAAAFMALKTAYAGKGVEVLMLDSVLGDKREAVIKQAKAVGIDMPILFDYEQFAGEQLKVTRAAEVIVINPNNWQIVYRGPVAQASGAVSALVAGQAVAPTSHPATGGLIAFPERAKSASFSQISYTHDIAPIIAEKCTSCHEKGGIGPMPLNNYEQVKAFSPMIREVIRTHRMPPYQNDETVGKWQDDGRLSPEQMKTMVHWVEGGASRGAGEDPLAKVKFEAPDWPLGKPDIILDVPAVTIPATGVMDYQHPAVANAMTEGRWMKATTFRISDRQVVHHILTGVVQDMPAPGATLSESSWGASLGGYGPGRGSNIEPADTGVWIPPSGGVLFQNHYTPYGKETTEKTQMGIYFYKKGEEPKYVLQTFLIANPNIVIPPDEKYHPEQAYVEFPHDAILYGITPHAHHRGGSANVSIRYPDGHEVMLLALPRYDFNWQYEYFLEKPITIPAGAKVVARWTYDNSATNPGNPDHTKMITWGEQSSDEMLATYLHFRWVGETVADQHPEWTSALQANTLIGMLDTNMDGVIEKTELKGRMGDMLVKYFAMIDTDHDGTIDAKELATAMKMMGRRNMFGSAPAKAAAAPAAPTAQAPAASAPVAQAAPAGSPVRTASR